MISLGSAVVLVALAAFLVWRGWGEGSWNLGPRLTAILGLAAGTALAVLIAPVAHGISGWTAHLLSMLLGAWPQTRPWVPLATTVVTYAPWVVGGLMLLLWIAAILPNRVSKERMSWELAMAGALIPALVSLGPVNLQTLASTVITTASSIGAAIGGQVAGGQPASGLSSPGAVDRGQGGLAMASLAAGEW